MNMKPNQSELMDEILKLKKIWYGVSILSLAIGILGFFPAIYMLQVYDRVVNSRDVNTLIMLSLVVVFAYAIIEILEKIRTRLLWASGIRFEMTLTQRVYGAMFSHRRALTQFTQKAVSGDMRSLREFFYNPSVGAFFELPIGLVAIILVFQISPLLGWVSIVSALLQAILGWIQQISTTTPLIKSNKLAMDANASAEEYLRNSQSIKAMGMLSAVTKLWQQKQNAFLIMQAKTSESAGLLGALSKFQQLGVSSLMIGLSAWLLLNDELNGGGAMLIVSSILGAKLIAPISKIIGQWRAISNVKESYYRVSSLLKEVPRGEPQMRLERPKGDLQIENLVASAPGQSELLIKNINFSINAGNILTIIGPSGAGKTSLTKLIIGIWQPRSGKVRLDGVDLTTWDKSDVGPYIGYLPQEVHLIDGTISENIARFNQVDPEKIEIACRRAGLQDFIKSLPHGYETVIERDGTLLSGGERQRLGLARAVYGSPSLIVLDEPNSSLDEAGDAALLSCISELKQEGSTVVIVSHKTNLLSQSDFALLLVEGEQKMFGPTMQVLERLNPAEA